ncbi:MAG: serine hydrolase [Bacteroidales bacterium]|nr:serine hydrolase [Bacteroidales bacterium]
MRRIVIFGVITAIMASLTLSGCSQADGSLPRGKASKELDKAMSEYYQVIADCSEEIHSIMVIQHGKVLAEKFFTPDTAHVLHSVSKTFTSTAVGFAISEGLLSLDDKIVDIFPESVPENPSENLKKVTIRNLLTMNSGHATDPTRSVNNSDGDWVKGFMEWPVEYEPGTCYCYNSLGTYVLSAAVQKVSGQKIVDYLDTRLWQPLNIEKPKWQESPAGINTGGWGLYLHTESLAKMGLCLLNGGKYKGKQVIPAEWVAEMSARQVPSVPSGTNEVKMRENPQDPSTSDWLQGYGYQMWRCRHNAFRADGAYGQYIIVMPEQDAVVAVTAHVGDMQAEINHIWDNILPALYN